MAEVTAMQLSHKHIRTPVWVEMPPLELCLKLEHSSVLITPQ
jgi:hypothetical protein